MSKSIRRGAIAAATVLLILVAFFAVPRGGGANAYVAESEFYLSKFEMLSSKQYYGAEEGCSYRVPIERSVYGDIIRIEYDVVPLTSEVDEIEVDEKNELKSERENVTHCKVLKSDLKLYFAPTERKYAYFDITAFEWCAFVFTVYYGDPEKAAYGSEILYCRNIDCSAPEAYYTSYYYDGGAYVFRITVNGNGKGGKPSANSGLKSFKALRRSANGQWTEYPSQTVSGLLSTTYELRTVTGQATYYMDMIDNVGNGARVPIVTFLSAAEDGTTTAAENALIDMEDAGYSENLINKLRDAKSNYELLLQIDGVTDTELSEARNAVSEILGYFASLEKLRKEGKKEYSVKTYNAEYLGEIDIVNSGKANSAQKYGDKADYIVSVAKFSAKDVDRKEAMKLANVKSAKEIYTLSLTLSDGVKDVETKFSEPLIIRIPREIKNVAAVQTSGGSRSVAKITHGNGYTDIEVSYSYGTVDLFVIGNGNNYLWFLMLIPAFAAIGVAVAIVIKRKKNKNSRKAATDTDGCKVDTNENK